MLGDSQLCLAELQQADGEKAKAVQISVQQLLFKQK